MKAMYQHDDQQLQELYARVQGYVQGVGFRQFVVHQATRLGLRGYTRNETNGDVEVVAQGDRSALERLCSFLRQGPSASEVSEVQITWRSPSEQFHGFHVRW